MTLQRALELNYRLQSRAVSDPEQALSEGLADEVDVRVHGWLGEHVQDDARTPSAVSAIDAETTVLAAECDRS